MSADGTALSSPELAKVVPTGLTPFKKGQSGNPGGMSKYERRLRRAIRKQEKPSEVCKVIAAMREDAQAHEKFSPAAAKVYLAAVGVDMKPKTDLRDVLEAMRGAPDEALQWFVAVKGRMGG